MRRDVLQQFPFLDTYYDRPIAPEDNVSLADAFQYVLQIYQLTSIALLNYLLMGTWCDIIVPLDGANAVCRIAMRVLCFD